MKTASRILSTFLAGSLLLPALSAQAKTVEELETMVARLEKITAIQQDLIKKTMVPTGTVVAFGSSRIPDGWLVADGREIEIAAAPALFSIVGTIYCHGQHGGGCAPGKFRLPNLEGRTVVGLERIAEGVSPRLDQNIIVSQQLGQAGGPPSVTPKVSVSQQPEFFLPADKLEGVAEVPVGHNWWGGGYMGWGPSLPKKTSVDGEAPDGYHAISQNHSHKFHLDAFAPKRTKDVEISVSPQTTIQPSAVMVYIIKK